jgi:predicted tellurium resistance membrane protein TerC
MDRFPVVITLGGALLGWIAGEMLVTDVAVKPLIAGTPHGVHYAVAAIGATLVVAIGKLLARGKKPEPVVELVVENPGGHAPQSESPTMTMRRGNPPC